MEPKRKQRGSDQKRNEATPTDSRKSQNTAKQSNQKSNPKQWDVLDWTNAIGCSILNFFYWIIRSLKSIDSLITALATVAIVVVAFLQLETFKKTDRTLNETLAANKLEQRAWVNVGFEIGGPLTIEDGIARISILFSLQNTGKLPALSVFPWAQLVPFTDETMGDVVADNDFPACKNRNETWMKLGTSVFPQEIAKLSAITVSNWPTSQRRVPNGSFNLMMVGCVLYRSAKEPEIYRTPFAIVFMRKKEGLAFVSTDKKVEAALLDKMKIPVKSEPD